jgi:hypothetical protein
MSRHRSNPLPPLLLLRIPSPFIHRSDPFVHLAHPERYYLGRGQLGTVLLVVRYSVLFREHHAGRLGRF